MRGVVMVPPTFIASLGLPERVKDFTVEMLVIKLGVDSHLPRAAGLDVSGSSPNSCNLFP